MSTVALQPYEITTRAIGFVKRERTRMIAVPRVVWLDLVQRAINEACDDQRLPVRDRAQVRRELEERLLPIARKMRRFPFGDWIHERRGCGCLVGEYLIAADILTRAEATARRSHNTLAVSEVLREQVPDDRLRFALVDVGYTIDRLLKQHLEETVGDPAVRFSSARSSRDVNVAHFI